MAGWLLMLVALAYLGLLFTVAWLGERHPGFGQGPRWRPAVYALALAVYCSSWTFYGAVGTAARTGLGFLPIYLGPILLLLFGWRILERLVLAAGRHRIVSIADFLSSRYGRARGLAAMVAVLATVAAIPYFALQFKAVGMSVGVLSGQPTAADVGQPAARGREHVGADGQAGAHDQRPQCQRRPVHQHALAQRALDGDAPDLVERLADHSTIDTSTGASSAPFAVSR